MRHSWRIYLASTIVFILSFGAAWALPTTDILRGIIGLPGVAALFAALFQIVRDQSAHERALELLEKQQLFSLGAASHMANVAFDKHVQFAEQYILRMQAGLTDLFRTGPPGESLKFSAELQEIRLSFRAWITKDIEAKVTPFEDALRKIGARRFLLEDLQPGPDRTRLVGEMYKIFSDVTGIPTEANIDEKVAAGNIMNHLQDLLGVQQLSRLRNALIERAIEALERKF